MTELTGLTVWGEMVKKVKTVITKNYMTKLCGERGVAKPINYADSVYTLRSKRSPAHILSRTPSRKNGSERVYTVSLAERWASNVLERRAIILP